MKKLRLGSTLITGGAGFIGSHLVDRLILNDVETKIVDNLSNGKFSNLKNSENSKNFHFLKQDLNNYEALKETMKGVGAIFHLAANPDVKMGFKQPEILYRENIQNTFHLLEAIRKADVKVIVFASSSTVYGEPSLIPTPEDYGPLIPISTYGASKLACEALISSYCHTYGINGLIFRLANIVGSRCNHGVIPDFINKLSDYGKKLDILGDGKQTKSYLHVTDCIDAILFCLDKSEKRTDVYNLGNDDKTDVMSIARIVSNCMSLDNVDMIPNEGVNNGRGWIGDVKLMHLDITKVKKLGSKPKLSSNLAVQAASKEFLQQILVKKIGNWF